MSKERDNIIKIGTRTFCCARSDISGLGNLSPEVINAISSNADLDLSIMPSQSRGKHLDGTHLLPEGQGE